MPRSHIDLHQAEAEFLSETEHTNIADSAPHHTRGHSLHDSTDHTNVESAASPVDGDALIWDEDAGEYQLKSAADPLGLTGEPTGFPNQTDSTISFNDGLLRFTIAPVGDDFWYYINGVKYTKTSAETVDITDTNGLWFIYYDDAVLTASQTPWEIDPREDGHAFVAVVYWNSTAAKHALLGEERHGFVMDWATHNRFHWIDSTRVRDPELDFQLINLTYRGDGSSNTHAQFGMTGGYIHDEDIIMHIVDDATPTERFEQILSTYAQIPVLYKNGSNTWNRLATTVYPVAYDPGNTLFFNYYNPSTLDWELKNMTSGYYLNMWLVASNDIDEPIIMLLGEHEYSSLGECKSESFGEIVASIPGLIHHEIVALYRVVYRTDTAYTNTPKAVIYDVSNIVAPIATDDRYLVKAWLAGNAGQNKYMDIYSGLGSNEAPFVFPELSFIRTVTIKSTAAATVTIGFFETSDLVNPVFTMSLASESYKRQDFSQFFNQDDELAVQVTSGSINKPSIGIYVQTDAG